MSLRTSCAAVGLALLVSAPAWADEPGTGDAKTETVWYADFDKAAEQARKEKKDLLVDFTGSDWCGWCKKLDKEVFSQPEFLEAAHKQYVLVALDFPHADDVKAKVPNPARNEELQAKYGVRGFPTILLVTPDGDVFGQTGYQPGGAASYVEHLAKLRDEGMPELTAAKELAKIIASATGPERAAAAEKAIAAFKEDASKAVTRILPVRAILAADPENTDGLAMKAIEALFDAGAADASSLGLARKLDPKNERGLFEKSLMAQSKTLASLDDVKAIVKECDAYFAAGVVKDKKVARELAFMAMFMNYQHLAEPAKAVDYAKKVGELGGFDTSNAQEARQQKLVDTVLANEGKAPERK